MKYLQRVTRGWRKLPNKELYDFYSPTNKIAVTYRMKAWTGLIWLRIAKGDGFL